MADLPPSEDFTTSAVAGGGVAPIPTATPPAKQTHHTRIAGTWIGVIFAAVVLVFLLVFILQNHRSVTIHFLSAKGSMPLGVALLLAAVGGVLIAAVAGSLRILQLRRRLSGQGASTPRLRRRRGNSGDAAQLG